MGASLGCIFCNVFVNLIKNAVFRICDLDGGRVCIVALLHHLLGGFGH